jgi:hypothetical protein
VCSTPVECPPQCSCQSEEQWAALLSRRPAHPERPISWFRHRLGAGRQVPFANHNPNYTVDLASIPVGAKIGTLKVLELLAK